MKMNETPGGCNELKPLIELELTRSGDDINSFQASDPLATCCKLAVDVPAVSRTVHSQDVGALTAECVVFA